MKENQIRRESPICERFHNACKWPATAQSHQLKAILSRNSETEFGTKHLFSSLRTRDEFRREVPLCRYADIVGYIERMKRGEARVLTADPVNYFALTSGTTDAKKFIPITRDYYLISTSVFSSVWRKAAEAAYPGRYRNLLSFFSEVPEERTEAGILCGGIERARHAWDPSPGDPMDDLVSAIHRSDSRYYAFLRLSFHQEFDALVTLLPSLLVIFAQKLTEYIEPLTRDLRDGTLTSEFEIPGQLRTQLVRWLTRDAQAAERLEDSLARHGRVRPVDAWPNLRGISCWQQGPGAAFYAQQLTEHYGDLPNFETGYLASEGFFAIRVSPEHQGAVVNNLSSVLEFIPIDRVHESQPETLTVEALQIGRQYEVVATGRNGLYRYRMGDIVQVTGMYQQTPIIKFLTRVGGVISITGEKVEPIHVERAFDIVSKSLGTRFKGYAALVDTNYDTPRYLFLVEEYSGEHHKKSWAEKVLCELEAALRSINSEYDKRRLWQQLDPPRLGSLEPGTIEEWRNERSESKEFDAPLARTKWPITADLGLLDEINPSFFVGLDESSSGKSTISPRH